MSIRIEDWMSIPDLVRMRIGTNKGTWFADPAFGSELWLLKKARKVDGQTAGILERMVRESLQWLIDDGLVLAVECTAERNGKSRIDYQVAVTVPAGAPVTVKEAWSVV
jgi:phage gp46-like protein